MPWVCSTYAATIFTYPYFMRVSGSARDNFSSQSVNLRDYNENQKNLQNVITELSEITKFNQQLSRLVELSNVHIVEKAQKEKADALKQAAEERKKASAAKKNAKEEITKAKRHAEKVISETKRKLSFWRMVAVGMFLVGAIIECSHVWM